MSYYYISTHIVAWHVDGLAQERHNSIADALELRLSCTNPSKFIRVQPEPRPGFTHGSRWPGDDDDSSTKDNMTQQWHSYHHVNKSMA